MKILVIDNLFGLPLRAKTDGYIAKCFKRLSEVISSGYIIKKALSEGFALIG